MDPASPKTPTARKAPPTTTPLKSRSRKASSSGVQKSRAKAKDGASEYSPPGGKKRKTKSDTASAKNAAPKGKSAGARGKATLVTPEKKQKAVHEEKAQLIDDATVSFPSLASQPQQQFPKPFHPPKISSPAFVDLSQEAPSTQHEFAYYMPQEPHPQQQSPFNVGFQQQKHRQAFVARRGSQTSLAGHSQTQQSPRSMGSQGQQSPPNMPQQAWKPRFDSPHPQQQSPSDVPRKYWPSGSPDLQQQFLLNMSHQQQGPQSGPPHQRQQSASSTASASVANQFMNDCEKDLLTLDQLIINVLLQVPFKTIPCVKTEAIDKITYRIHDLCIRTGLLNVAAKCAAIMLSETKLRALALLNFMATWWFLRERVVTKLVKMGVKFDDTTMQSEIRDASAIASQMMKKITGADKAKDSMESDNL